MNAAHRTLVALLLFTPACGSGFGLAQTAKTVQPRSATLRLGVAGAYNENHDFDRGSGSLVSALSHHSLETAMRIGVGGNTDIGFGPWLAYGAQLDAKHDFVPRERPYGLALRGGASYAIGTDIHLWSMFVGTIASWELLPGVTPYLGITYRDHWVYQPTPPPPTDGSHWASRKGYGDGLLQTALGLKLGSGRTSAYLEYGRWLPMQDDPGDFYAFVATHVVSITIGFCLDPGCKGN